MTSSPFHRGISLHMDDDMEEERTGHRFAYQQRQTELRRQQAATEAYNEVAHQFDPNYKPKPLPPTPEELDAMFQDATRLFQNPPPPLPPPPLQSPDVVKGGEFVQKKENTTPTSTQTIIEKGKKEIFRAYRVQISSNDSQGQVIPVHVIDVLDGLQTVHVRCPKEAQAGQELEIRIPTNYVYQSSNTAIPVMKRIVSIPNNIINGQSFQLQIPMFFQPPVPKHTQFYKGYVTLKIPTNFIDGARLSPVHVSLGKHATLGASPGILLHQWVKAHVSPKSIFKRVLVVNVECPFGSIPGDQLLVCIPTERYGGMTRADGRITLGNPFVQLLDVLEGPSFVRLLPKE
ncbi:expressed unknown protein [Seminavis robusta]|uniref:Uncharacterized protein n=1 Tax=Seminavis robusta TaxID=568900 RepID=A0A9N8DX09_9STRA|nr:expressed unknown protein [Seminavis robusta]|eukprot:Sro336_g120360.1 n/a (345) ;mRNA; f:43242-44276